MTDTAAARPMAAAGSVVAAMALIALIDNLVVVIAGLGGLWQFHLMRAAVALPLIWLTARATGRRLAPLSRRAVVARSFLVSVSMVLYFGSLGFLPVAEAAAGLFTAPIWVLLISVLILREKVGWRRGLAVLTGFAGILLVLRPGAAGLPAAALMPVAAGLFYALGALVTRRWCAGEGVLTLLTGFFIAMTVWGALGSFALTVWPQDAPPGPEGFMLRGWQAPGAAFLALTAVQAVGAVLGVGLLTRGYLLAEASFVAAFEYVFLIFAALWGWVLWGAVPDTLGWAGIALIVASGAVLAVRSRSAPAAPRGLQPD